MPSKQPKGHAVPSFARIVVAFAVVAGGFVLAAIFGEVRASGIDREADRIETNALPSVEHLAAARAALWRVEIACDRYLDSSAERRRDAAAAISAARQQLDDELTLELATPHYPGELELEPAVTRALRELDGLLHALSQVPAGEDAHERDSVLHQVQTVVEDADVALEKLSAVNAAGGYADVRRIEGVRESSVQLLLVLNIGCVAFACVAAFVALRSLQRRRNIELAHDALLVAQASELERFASRVAHDLLSPLSALAFTLSSLKRNSERGSSIADPLERAWACLRRSQALVNGVMDFARSGGTPGRAQASLRRALDGVLEDLPDDAAGIDVRIEGVGDDILVACSAGVLTSILSNLVRNAIKYMEGRPERRLTVRALSTKSSVRVEVEDTGPGLPPGLEQHVFEPYVRSPDHSKPGLGLGLATVERFVEAHGGRVGVDSAPAEGCLFWFELPPAPERGAANDVEAGVVSVPER